MSIDFYFQEEEKYRVDLMLKYNPLSFLADAYLKEFWTYKFRRIKFNFCSRETYDVYMIGATIGCTKYKQDIGCCDILVFSWFDSLSDKEQTEYLWHRVYSNLLQCAEKYQDEALRLAVEAMYKKGVETDYYLNSEVFSQDIELYGVPIRAYIWGILDAPDFWAKAELVLEKEGKEIFRTLLYSAPKIESVPKYNAAAPQLYSKIFVDAKNRVIVQAKRDYFVKPIHRFEIAKEFVES